MPFREERLAILRPAHAPGVEILDAKDCIRGWHVFHERYAACACDMASADYFYRARNHVLDDRTVGMMQPGEVHRNTAVRKYSDFKVVFLDTDLLIDAGRQAGMRSMPRFRAEVASDPRTFHAIYDYCQAVEQDAPRLEQDERLTECVSALLSHTEDASQCRLEVGRSEEAARRIRSYIVERCAEDITLDDLAHVSRLSRFYVAHVFKRYMGLAPHAFQVHVRIERARALLAGGLSLAETASKLGFADQSHFTRHFKRVMHMTPGHYTARR